MEMIQTLKFLQGAVSTKDLIPEMKHITIKDGVARSYNGLIAISSPIDFHVDCSPKAGPLIAAIDRCQDTTSLAMTEAGRLRIKSGGFKAFIDCIDDPALNIQPEGEMVEIEGEPLIGGLKKLLPFVGKDASRPWVNGILLRGQSAFATNNACLIEYWMGTQMPFVVNIPKAAIMELVRVSDFPTHIQLSQSSITFHYSDGRWIKSQLFETNWPDLTKILDRPSEQAAAPAGLFAALDDLKPFVDRSGTIYIEGDQVSTSQEEELGASYRVEGLEGTGIYRLEMLRLLEGVAKTIDFKLYPQPLLFYGDRIRGAIVGYRG